MRIEQTYVRFVAIAIMANISSVLGGLENSWDSNIKPRRFLFQPSTTSQQSIYFCTLYCPLRCPNGYVRSVSGCYLCQCAIQTVSVMTSSAITTPAAVYNGGVFFDKPCNPALRHCKLQCSAGYKLGANGCQYCICETNVTNPATIVTNTTAMSTLPTSQTIQQQLSTKRLVTSRRPAARPYTVTQRPSILPPISTATVSTTTHAITTTPTQPTHKMTTPSVDSSAYNDPCIPSQKTCKNDCAGEYVRGPDGCQYCLCMSRLPAELRHPSTTATPTSTAGKGPKQQSTVLLPSSPACIMAKIICNQKCQNGFISRPDDCLYCVCNNNTGVSQNDPQTADLQLPRQWL